ncbi:unnamed protein product [Adineta steineri]|uniref:PID domain-containing protein n=1 Tax=Adineta steineri TaxID=433720 RepID=A0A818PN86_9BILA|nr:unnamed protein product [Adineta steineri]CAF3624353.1 unnamed protein product [Adineta steineri]
MARKEEYHRQQHQMHYATIMPIHTTITNGNDSNISPLTRKQTNELERAKALYVEFDDAFQEETRNHDYFGFQPSHDDSYEPANFYLQSVETISEVKNTSFSPFMRRRTSRENSRPSTPSDSSPNQRRHNHRPNQPPPLPPASQNHNITNINGITNLSRDFNNLNLIHTNHIDESPAPFTPDAILLKIKQNEYVDAPVVSSQYKLLLPQYFLVKYLGRKPCVQLWGSKAVRGPIDEMVESARQISSMNEMPTLEACINTRGLTLTHRQSPTRTKHNSRNHSPERHQHGLIPLEHISYVMHDVKYSKISACIVLRQPKSSSTDSKITNETVTECYAFLFQSKDHGHRFALSLAEAFNAQQQSSRGIKQNHDDKREGHSPRRRSKHRPGLHQHEKTRSKYDDTYLRDSEV